MIIIIIVFILGILILVFQEVPDEKKPEIKTYSGNGFTFNYPGNWENYTEYAHPNEIGYIVLGDPETETELSSPLPSTMVTISKMEDNPHPEGVMSKRMIQEWLNTTRVLESYQNISVSVGNLTLDESKARKFASDLLIPNASVETFLENLTKNVNILIPKSKGYQNISVSTRNFTVDGATAYEFVFIANNTGTNMTEYTRNIVIEKNRNMYVIACFTVDVENLEATKKEFEMIVKSLKI